MMDKYKINVVEKIENRYKFEIFVPKGTDFKKVIHEIDDIEMIDDIFEIVEDNFNGQADIEEKELEYVTYEISRTENSRYTPFIGFFSISLKQIDEMVEKYKERYK